MVNDNGQLSIRLEVIIPADVKAGREPQRLQIVHSWPAAGLRTFGVSAFLRLLLGKAHKEALRELEAKGIVLPEEPNG